MSSTEDRIRKFKELRSQRRQVDVENRKDLYKEHQRNKTNPHALKKLAKRQEEAELDLLKLDNKDGKALDDVERKKLWNYSVEDNEAWEAKLEKTKGNKANAKVRDYDALAERTYLKRVEEIAKQKKKAGENDAGDASKGGISDNDGEDYNFDHKPSRDNVDLLVGSLRNAESRKITKTNKNREKNGKGTTSYINRKNKEFNEKLSRHYDRYTKDLRDNLDKGSII